MKQVNNVVNEKLVTNLLKELEEFYMLEKETEKSDARKVAVLMKGYLQSMKSNI